MVLVGLGIILLSLSFLVYVYRNAASTRQPPPIIFLEEDGSDTEVTKSKSIQPEGRKKESRDGSRLPSRPDSGHQHVGRPNSAPGRLPKTINPQGEQAVKPKQKAVPSAEDKPRISYPYDPKNKQSVMPTPSIRPTPNGNLTTKPPSTTLMPPPPLPPSNNTTGLAPPKPSTPIRPPPSTASTLRAPPSRSLAPPSSLAPSTSTLAPNARLPKKVLLDPGHSPLDWAHLLSHPPTPNFLRGNDVPQNLIRVPPSLLYYHSGRKGKNAWGVYQGKVYNLSPYMKFHPGGVDQLMRGAGRETDGERLFNETHPWVSWENMLGECLVGILVSESEAQGKEGEGLEEID